MPTGPIEHSITPDAVARLERADSMIRLLKPVACVAKASPPGGSVDHRAATILRKGSNWTIVPNSAVLFVPEKLKS